LTQIRDEGPKRWDVKPYDGEHSETWYTLIIVYSFMIVITKAIEFLLL